MLAEVVGSLLALLFFGLPLGIIGLFILSIVDQRDKRTVESNRATRERQPDKPAIRPLGELTGFVRSLTERS